MEVIWDKPMDDDYQWVIRIQHLHILSINLKKKGYHDKCYNINIAQGYFDNLNKDMFY